MSRSLQIRATADANSATPAATDVEASNRALALRVAEILAETPAANTVVMDVRELSSFADYFIVCSGENERQLRAIYQTLLDKLSEEGQRPQRSEGAPGSGWIVMDFGDVIVHVFEENQRAFYRLESLWAEAPTLLAIQ